jgi:hypothetical protein
MSMGVVVLQSRLCTVCAVRSAPAACLLFFFYRYRDIFIHKTQDTSKTTTHHTRSRPSDACAGLVFSFHMTSLFRRPNLA